MTEIRTFEPKDVFSVIKLANQTLTEKYSSSLFSYFYETNPDGFIIANLNHKIIGFLIGIKIKNYKTKILMISVLPQYQKQKIGTKLLEEFIKRTQKEKINIIELEVRTDNFKAIKFYEKETTIDRNQNWIWTKDIFLLTIILTSFLTIFILSLLLISQIVSKEWFAVIAINSILPITSTNMFLVPYGINKKVTALSVTLTTIVSVPIVVALIFVFNILFV